MVIPSMAGPDQTAPVTGTAVDTHCHLFLLDDDPSTVVEAAGIAGVGRLLCVGIDPATSRRSAEIATSTPGVFATAGMHPHTASDLDGKARGEIEELVGDPQVVAVGECGLDFYRMLSPRSDQETTFRYHLDLSREAGLPVVVHVRDAWPAALRLLDEGSPSSVVLHCFSGDAAVAEECSARGYFLSFAGNVTYPRSRHLREAAARTPRDRLLAETDSPFLSPQGLRGRDNTPANVVAVIQELARVHHTSFEGMRDLTAANAATAFPRLA
jgi:TatD DNase family protein